MVQIMGAPQQWPPGPGALAGSHADAVKRQVIHSGAKCVGDGALLQQECGNPTVCSGFSDYSVDIRGRDEYVSLDQGSGARRFWQL